MKTLSRVAVLGGGAWGTALAQALSASGHTVTLWARNQPLVDAINTQRVNTVYLPGVPLSANIHATSSLAEAARADAILIVVPAQHVGAICAQLAGFYNSGTPLIMCAKGIATGSAKLMAEVVGETLPAAEYAVLSGPSFAADVAAGLPTALTLASRNETLGRRLAESLSSRSMRLYWSSDVRGVELGGAVKNVLAIAAGIVSGRGLGASAHAAIVARGFAELRRFAEALGGRPETLMGLSGLGDLILTCGSPQSRNMSLGRALGAGQSLEHILAARNAVTEGVYTASAVVALAQRHGIDMPISETVHAIIEERLKIDEAIDALLSRPLKAED